MRKLFTACLLAMIAPFAAADPTAGINYITEEFPPYNFKGEDGKPSGINTDVLAEMFKRMGSANNYDTIKLQPWVRGYRTTQEAGSMNVLYSTTRTEERENLFKWVGPLSDSINEILSTAEIAATMKVNSSEDLKAYKFAAIKDDIGEQLLKKYGVPAGNISLSTNFYAMIKKLDSGKVQGISYNGIVARWLMKKDGQDPSKLTPVFSEKLGQHYFAFNKDIDDSIVEAHQKALDEVKGDQGFMQKTQDKYLK